MFGTDLLVAPLFANSERRKVYLPPGSWIDYQSGRVYEGAKWHDIAAGAIPVVLLVKNHSVLPHIKVAQSTKDMDIGTMSSCEFSARIVRQSADSSRGLTAIYKRFYWFRAVEILFCARILRLEE